MVRINWLSWGGLACFLGLVLSFSPARAQDMGDAYQACFSGYNAAKAGTSAQYYASNPTYGTTYNCEQHTITQLYYSPASFMGKTGYALRYIVFFNGTAGLYCPESGCPHIPNPPAGIDIVTAIIDGQQALIYVPGVNTFCSGRANPGTVTCSSDGTTNKCIAGCTMYITNTSGTCSGSWTQPGYDDERGSECISEDNSSSSDLDGDGTPNDSDVCPYSSTNDCAEGDSDGDGIPNGQDPCPELANSTTCDAPAGDSDGDGVPNSTDPCPTDATNACPAGDSDGDGSPNGEDPCPDDVGNSCPGTPLSPDGPGQAGGGIGCTEAPTCSADAVDCAVLFQLWQNKCNTKDGKSLLTQIKDLLTGTGENGEPTDEENSSGLAGLTGTKAISTDVIDESGFGLPRSCPVWNDITFSVMSSTVTIPLSGFTMFCDILEWTGILIVAFAAFWSARILIKGD